MAEAQVETKLIQGDHIQVVIRGEPFLDFYIGSAHRIPFVANVRAANGQLVTCAFPDRGLWIGYGDVNGVDFWDGRGSNAGRIAVTHLGELQSGKKIGSVEADFAWRDPQGADVVEEHRVLTFREERATRIIDIETALTAKIQVRFGNSSDGFLAVHPSTGMAQTSSEADRVDFDAKRPGQELGFAILNDPKNLKSPPQWRTLGSGLEEMNPLAGLTIEAGQTIRFAYRVAIYVGSPPRSAFPSAKQK
jgi:hypothetical protein